MLKTLCVYLQVSCELSVLLDGLLVVSHSLLSSFNTFLGLSDSGAAQVQHLPQLQLRLSGVLLQLVVHLIYSFLKGGDNQQGQSLNGKPLLKFLIIMFLVSQIFEKTVPVVVSAPLEIT